MEKNILEKAKKISDEHPNLDDNASTRLKRVRENAEKQFKDLGTTKLSILRGNVSRFNKCCSCLKNIDAIAPDYETQKQIIRFNNMLPSMQKNIEEALRLNMDRMEEKTLTAIGVYGINETLGIAKLSAPMLRRPFFFAAAIATPMFAADFSRSVINPFKSLLKWLLEPKVKIPPKNNPEPEEIKNFRMLLTSLVDSAKNLNVLLSELEIQFKVALDKMTEIIETHGYDCRNYSGDEALAVFKVYKFAEVTNFILNINLRTADGKLNQSEIEKALNIGQALLDNPS